MATPNPGDHIRNVRKRLGLTLSELGARTGLAVSTLSKLEKGNVSLSYDKLMLLSRGLGVDMAELLSDAPGARPANSGGSGRRVVHRAGEMPLVQQFMEVSQRQAEAPVAKAKRPAVKAAAKARPPAKR